MIHVDDAEPYSSNDRSHHLPCSAVVAELTEIDALPCSEVQSPVSNGNVDAHARNDALSVSWHIIGPLKDVSVVRNILRHKPVVNRLHVSSHIWIPVLAIAFFRSDSAKLKQAWLCSRCSVSSQMLKAQLVCCTKRLSSPVFGNCGRCWSTSSVIRWKPRGRGLKVNDVCWFIIILYEQIL